MIVVAAISLWLVGGALLGALAAWSFVALATRDDPEWEDHR